MDVDEINRRNALRHAQADADSLRQKVVELQGRLEILHGNYDNRMTLLSKAEAERDAAIERGVQACQMVANYSLGATVALRWFREAYARAEAAERRVGRTKTRLEIADKAFKALEVIEISQHLRRCSWEQFWPKYNPHIDANHLANRWLAPAHQGLLSMRRQWAQTQAKEEADG